MSRTILLRAAALFFSFVLMSAAKPVVAQGPSRTAGPRAESVDSRWVPWLGCWQLREEGLRETDAVAPSITPEVSRLARVAGDLRVCVVPADSPLGVRMTTLAGDKSVLEQTIVADGTDRPTIDSGCRGSQRTEWSQNGQRLFARAELACGAQPLRRVSGLSLMTLEGSWVDIQAVEIDGNESVRVRRYRRAGDQTPVATVLTADLLARAESAAQLAGAKRLSVDEVIEATKKIGPRPVEAALIETRARFDLKRDVLIKLDDGGVQDSVIDLMVALSYPDHFVVDRRRDDSSGSFGGISSSFGLLDPLLYSGFDPYYYYSPFGYSSWASYYGYGYGPFYTFSPGTFVVVPGGGGTTAPSGAEGRVINGLGYTRVRPRDSSNDQAVGQSGQSAGRVSSTPSSGGSVGSSSSGSSSSGVSPQGASSGGSGDTGRTAVPR